MSERMTLDEFKKSIAPASVKNDYKARFLRDIANAGIPAPTLEVKFHDTRKWRLDFAYPDRRIAIEYQGGNFSGGKGGHSSIAGLMRDYEKFTEAALHGWLLILIDAASVRSGQAVEWVRRAMEVRNA